MRASIKEVAERAQVSAMTVSRVINSDARVAPGTRERVLQVIREMDYVPVSQPGTQRRNKQTHTIGLVFDQLDELRDYVGFQTYLGLRDGAHEVGYDLLLLVRNTPEWAQGREEVSYLDRRTDGIIFVNPFRRFGLMERLVAEKVPVVSCGYHNPPGVVEVIFEERSGMLSLVRHLHEQGHRKLGFLAGPGELGADVRRDGFLLAAKEVGVANPEKNVFPGTKSDTWRSDKEALEVALEGAKKRGLTALLCANDYLAAAVMKRADSIGLRVPEDLAITGVDDVPLAEQKAITTLAHPFALLGQLAVNALVEVLRGVSVEKASRRVSPELVVRASSGGRD